MCITKTLSLLVNGVLLASGVALVIVAVFANEVSLKYLTTQPVDLKWIWMLLALTGAIAAAGAISGLVGACCCEIKYLLYLSFGLILTVFIMETMFVIRSSVETVDKFNNFIDNDARDRMLLYNDPSTSVHQEWDNFQIYGECCGFNTPRDWRNVAGLEIPKSCCKDKKECLDLPREYFTQGCKDILKEKFMETINILRWSAYGLMFVHAAAGAFAVFMMVKAALCGCCFCC